MKSLQEIFNEIGNLTTEDRGCNDKGGPTHTYLEVYDKLFEPFRNGCTFMEIGLATGESMELFDQYFNNSKILGVDISIVFEAKQYKNEVYLIQADATKPLKTFYGVPDLTFDIIIDDGSHVTQDQITTFNLLKDKMNPGGIYIIEDLLALDIEREKYLALHDNVEIIDMRKVNGRFDNALCIIRF